MEKIKTKKFEMSPVYDHKQRKRKELKFGELDQGSWDRRVENNARQSFRQTEELRLQAETIGDINKIREGVKADIKGKVKRLMNIPANKRTHDEDVFYENLPKDLQKLIDKKHKERYGF